MCACVCIHIFVGPVEPQPASKFVWLCWRRRCRCWRQRLCRRCHCVTFCAHTVAALPPCQAQTYWICRHFLLCTSVSDWEKACGFAVCQCVCVCSPGSIKHARTHTHTHADTNICACIGVVHVHNAGKRQTRILKCHLRCQGRAISSTAAADGRLSSNSSSSSSVIEVKTATHKQTRTHIHILIHTHTLS